MLDDYNAVLPGLAERIVTMAEKEQGHYHVMDRVYMGLRFFGQIAALALALAGIFIGADLIRDGHDVEGLATVIAALAPIVGAFLYRQITSGNGAAGGNNADGADA